MLCALLFLTVCATVPYCYMYTRQHELFRESITDPAMHSHQEKRSAIPGTCLKQLDMLQHSLSIHGLGSLQL